MNSFLKCPLLRGQFHSDVSSLRRKAWSVLSILSEFLQHPVGAMDSRPQAGAGEPRGSVGEDPAVPLLLTPCPSTLSHVIPGGLRERSSLCLSGAWIDHKTGEWMKPALFNKKHKSSSVYSVTVWEFKNDFLLFR